MTLDLIMRPFIKLPLSDLMDTIEYYNHQGQNED